ncbi:MAG TPA: DUF5663 domain-containing protein [bacterium]|nr:DUF5663 domain-containing protein [bacterium]
MLNNQTLQENIIKSLGLTNLPEDKKILLLQKMTEVVEQRLTGRLMEVMSEDQQNIFAKIAQESPQKVEEFIWKFFPNFLEITQEEIDKLKQELIDNLDK